MSDDKITEIPVRPKVNRGRVLEIVYSYGKCRHESFLIDEQLATVECANCHAHLNPMEILVRLAHQETRWHQLHAHYKDEMTRLGERRKTKCRHCHKMTDISRR